MKDEKCIFKRCLDTLEVNDNELLELMREYCPRFGVDTPARVSAFISQLWVESRLQVVGESFNFDKHALIRLFKGRISYEDAELYGRGGSITKGTKQLANEEAIANIIYGGEWGVKNLGNIEEGDGWKFRGRGFIQLTGHSNYQRLDEIVKWGLIDNPDLLLEKGNALISALVFWHVLNRTGQSLNMLADVGDIRRISMVVNGGIHGLNERRMTYEKLIKAVSYKMFMDN